MPPNDRGRPTDIANDQRDAERHCPACGTHIESVEKVGAVTFVLEPCGHQVDDRVLAEVWTD